jgi:Ca2+-transporting ATPase
LINAVLGYTQEYKAQTSIEALRKIAAPKAKVLRDGVRIQIETAKLVPGDIIFLETGNRVPADARLIDTVEKIPDPLASNLQMGERKNMLFSSTIIVNGRGTAAVTATGVNTEIGRIAQLIQAEDESTPLEKKL